MTFGMCSCIAFPDLAWLPQVWCSEDIHHRLVDQLCVIDLGRSVQLTIFTHARTDGHVTHVMQTCTCPVNSSYHVMLSHIALYCLHSYTTGTLFRTKRQATES